MAESPKSRWSKVKSWIQSNSWVDCMPAVAAFFVAFIFVPNVKNDLSAFYAGLSALAGILMSSITFTIMLAYGSNSSLMRIARKNHRDNFVRNWVSMVGFSLLSALLPLISMLVGEFMKIGPALAAGSMVLVIEEALRCIFWVRFTLLMDSYSQEQDMDDFDQKAAVAAVEHYASDSD